MSYILEALKKLEKKRMKESVPGLLYGHDHKHPLPEVRPLWPYLLAAALLVNAVFLLWWLRPWQTKSSEYMDSARQSQPAPAVAAGAGLTTGTLLKATENTGVGASSDNKTTAQAVSLSGREPVKSKAYINQEKREEPRAGRAGTSVIEPPDVGKRSRENAGATVDKRIYGMNELPPSVSQGLPKLAVSGHFYSDNPGSRVVVINGRLAHEGAEVSRGLVLERINSDGLVFAYQGYRFRVGVF